MADYRAMLDEEFEVLESIYPDELEKISETEVRIRVEPDEGSSSHPLSLDLVLIYPPTYPDVAPEISFETIDEESGELAEEEMETVLAQLNTTVEESLGMAMTFTLVTACREALSGVVSTRLIREQEEEDRKTKAYEEAEAARTRGTPLTPASFQSFRQRISAELQSKRDKEEEDRIKTLPPREREDIKKRRERLSGRQLFETSKVTVDADEGYYEEGATEIDLSKYTREEREKERRREEEEEEKRREGLLADGED